MPLSSSTPLAPNFSAAELGADSPDASPVIVSNLYTVAAWLQAARNVLGVPLRITSGFRTAAHNAIVGGASDSDHVTGLAADFEAQGLTPFQVYQGLTQASQQGLLPPFDQLIYYQSDDHVHVGLGSQTRSQVLIKTAEGSYLALVGGLVNSLRGYL